MLNIFSLPNLRLKLALFESDRITLSAHSLAKNARCSCCNKKSKNIHGYYIRKLRDLPSSSYSVSIELVVRKFFCKNPKCKRKIFSEQSSPEISAYARMTNRTKQRLNKILIEVSANKGADFAKLLCIPISSSTALRLVDQIPLPPDKTVTVLGIDDWAFRKGSTYGTILVDNERCKVIDILQGRDGYLLKDWLKVHPEIKVVTRDRSSAFSIAVTDILPDAIQVADRFHLYKNLSTSVYEVIRSEYGDISKSLSQDKSNQECKNLDTSELDKKPPLKSHYESRFDKAKEMMKNGSSIHEIARQLKMSRISIRNYISMDKYYVKHIIYWKNYAQYQHYITDMLSKGVSKSKIYEFIKKEGFNGALSSFNKYMKTFSPSTINEYRMLSPRKISRYLRYKDLSKIKDSKEQKTIVELLRRNEILSLLRNQLLAFNKMFIDKNVSMLDEWIHNTLNIGKSQLKTFVHGLKTDIEAVKNAIVSEWSNGQVEGQVNRLKSIKRQMYGRAGFELLRKKVVLGTAG